MSDQIASIASQVAQVTQDPSTSVDVKTQQINTLAGQFNQLVTVWQQQAAAVTGTAAAPVTGTGAGAPGSTIVPSTAAGAGAVPNSGTLPPPSGVSSLAPSSVSGLPTPAPTASAGITPTQSGTTADQLRQQISTVSQQMASISQDASIPNDLKVTQLTALGAQFNMLMTQLQMTGG